MTKIIGVALVEHCKTCRKRLPKGNKHHYYCHKCWEERQISMGNLALIGGIR